VVKIKGSCTLAMFVWNIAKLARCVLLCQTFPA